MDEVHHFSGRGIPAHPDTERHGGGHDIGQDTYIILKYILIYGVMIFMVIIIAINITLYHFVS